ncbi:zinc uptake transcriptional repressor Zur [Proteus cibi]|uniref:zinc uptake transcriptional repressor Zur n=1 Tax=Proteus cibi TaxID=2050966 RepID=UPI0032DB3849
MNEEKLLAQAEKICQKRGVRLTSQRLAVLRLIMQQPSAISAYDLLDLLRQVEPQAKPPTVYRGLEFLLEQGFIHKIESTNSYVLCHHFDDIEHTSVMLICDRCLFVTEKNSHHIENAIEILAKENGFHLRHSVIEIHGLCSQCQEAQECTHPEGCHHDHSMDENLKQRKTGDYKPR